MPIINFTNPISVVVGVILFLLVLYLAKETKKAWIVAVMLFAFIAVLIGHTIEFATIAQQSEALYKVITTSTIYDFAFILLSFLSYLWLDQLEVKEGKRKSIDNSLAWFWNKV